MASIGHIAVGIATARAWAPRDASRGQLWRTSFAFAALSMLPDADVVAFWFGIPYEHPWGHRGATHSLVFAVAVALLALVAAKRLKLQPVPTFFAALVCVGTHGLLDTLTNGGLGAELLWPFSTERFFAPVTPIPVAPIGLGMLSVRGLLVVVIETVMFAPLIVYATFPKRQAAVPVAAVLAVLEAGVAGWLLSNAPRAPERPLTPSFEIHARAEGMSVYQLEQAVAQPLEDALVTQAQRLRTRITLDGVEIEVWSTREPDLKAALPKLPAAMPTPIVSKAGPRRPDPAACAAPAARSTVRIDPLKLEAMHVTALDVANAVAADAGEVAALVRVSDVAVLEQSAPSARCHVEGELASGDDFSTVRLESPTPPALSSAAWKLAVTREPHDTTLYFSPPLDAPTRRRVLDELLGAVRHADGVRRVRLVFSGADREQLEGVAGVVVRTLKYVKGIEWIVPPPGRTPQFRVKVDRARASELGVDTADIQRLVDLATHGLSQGGMLVTADLGKEREHLGALMIRDRRLSEFITLTNDAEPDMLTREDAQPSIEVFAYGIDKQAVPVPALPGGVSLEIYEEL